MGVLGDEGDETIDVEGLLDDDGSFVSNEIGAVFDDEDGDWPKWNEFWIALAYSNENHSS